MGEVRVSSGEDALEAKAASAGSRLFLQSFHITTAATFGASDGLRATVL